MRPGLGHGRATRPPGLEQTRSACPGRVGGLREGDAMTPDEWERCCDLWHMLEFLIYPDHPRQKPFVPHTGRVGERPARLFAAACCRQVWPLLTDARSRAAVEAAERCGEDPAAARALHRAAGEGDYVDYPEAYGDDDRAAAQAWLDGGADPRGAAGWRAAFAAKYAAHAAYCAAAAALYACRARRGEFWDLWKDRASLRRAAWDCAGKAAQSASLAATAWSE